MVIILYTMCLFIR